MFLPRFFAYAGAGLALIGGAGAAFAAHVAFWLNLSLLALGVVYLVVHKARLDEEENVMVAKIGAMLALASSVAWMVAEQDFALTVPSIVAAVAGMVGVAVFVAEEKALEREMAKVEDNRS